MGLFNKTEEEIKRDEELKKIRAIQNLIYEARSNSVISNSKANFFYDYVDGIKNGKPNDFGDLDTLYKVISGFIEVNDNLDGIARLKNNFEEVILRYNQIVKTDNREEIKDYFIDTFIIHPQMLDKAFFDESFYALFKDKKDYFEIMEIILEKDLDYNDFYKTIKYANMVSKYSLNQDMLKREIAFFINGILDLVTGEEIDKFFEESLDEAKRRIGIYNISQKELALVDSKLRRIENYMEEFDLFERRINDEKNAVSTLIESGRKDIKEQTKSSIESLKRIVEEEKSLLIKKLDDYLLDLEEVLKSRSDDTFRSIIETYQNQVQEFRNLFIGYSKTVSKDFLEIQKSTEESVKKLQNYVNNEPQLQQLLTKAQEQNMVGRKLVELVNKEEELKELSKSVQTVSVKEPPSVVIPGYDERVMVPYKHMILPDKISSKVIPVFDERIPFNKRMKMVEDKINEMENNGEIFHAKTKQIIIDLMEGDWPYLWGPSGTGKSYMAKQIASIIGLPLTKAGKITEPYSVLGYNDPQGRFQITPSFIAALYGNILFLDELDNGNPDTQVVLNDIYSELLNKLDDTSSLCEVTFGTDVNVDINPNFRMIAAGNTSGEGENEAFSSRGKMDESIQERMTPIYIDYDGRVEERILNAYPEWYKFFINFRKACLEYSDGLGLSSASGITTTRDAAALKKYIEHNSKSLTQVIQERFVQIKDSEYRKALGRTIASMYNIDYDECANPKYNGQLSNVKGQTLAKKFVYICKNGVR